jgi:hypothetical protein
MAQTLKRCRSSVSIVKQHPANSAISLGVAVLMIVLARMCRTGGGQRGEPFDRNLEGHWAAG